MEKQFCEYSYVCATLEQKVSYNNGTNSFEKNLN